MVDNRSQEKKLIINAAVAALFSKGCFSVEAPSTALRNKKINYKRGSRGHVQGGLH
jgi:hypothetical protein